MNEARTAAGLHHTHIVPVFDVGQVGGLCYYAMQRIELREGVTSDATRTTLRVNPDQIKLGLGVTMTATVADTSVLSIVPEGGGVTFTDSVGGVTVTLNGGAAVARRCGWPW